MINQYTSLKNLNAWEKFNLMRIGMRVEYSDPANDMDDNNFGTVLYRDLQRRRNILGQGFYLFNIRLQLLNNKEITISAGQILAYSEGEK